jgi:nickel-dependent lactate racemase
MSIVVKLPYGKSEFKVTIPRENLLCVLQPHDLPGASEEEEIRRAVCNPVKSKRIHEIAEKGDKVAIVISDITRRCPDNKIVPIVLSELSLAGVREQDVTIVVALGIHRKMQGNELTKKLGKDVYKRIKVLNHDYQDKKSLRYLGRTKTLRTPVWINREVVEADVKITTGVVEFHTFAGYSGGRKSISPGVAGRETILATHAAKAIDQPNVGIGVIKGNPIHEDMVEAAHLAGVDFIVNVVLNSKNELVRAAAGDLVCAHEELINIYDRIYKVEAPDQADIVISVPAYPKNINLFQATRAANNLVLVPKPTIRQRGVIIIPATCQNGVGDETFYSWMKNAKHPQEIIDRAYEETRLVVDKPFILAKILNHTEVVISNSRTPDKIIREMHMIPVRDVQEGLKLAFKKLGSHAKVLVLLHGISTLPV